ncbi:MAG TPA: UDP-N-acetylmuramoyl-L-alanine--D-glutamate ligase, partial [Abditibacterium sp.]
MNEFQGKTAAVIGLARAGAPAAKFLAQRGARVIGFDGKTRENLSAEALELETLGVELQLGEHGFAGIESCDLIVLSPGLKVHFEPLKSLIADAEARGSEVIGELELAYRFCPCPIIGVTGTKGKSTTTKLITEMLQACGVEAISAGNTGTPLISVLPQLKSESRAVVEVSSFQLEKAPTFRPKIAVLLSLLEDHQDYHPTLEQYWETKLKIFANQESGDHAVFNVDDERVKLAWWHGDIEALSKTRFFQDDHAFKDVFVVPVSSKEAKDLDPNIEPQVVVCSHDGGICIKNAAYLLNKDRFEPVIASEEIPLKGVHNLSNVAAAIAVVREVVAFDKNKEKIANAIRNFQTLPHRLEIVARKDGITWVNDSQSTIPDASIAALKSFPSPVTLLVGGRAKIEASAYEGLMRAVRDANAKLALFGEAAEMLFEVAVTQGVEKSQIVREK